MSCLVQTLWILLVLFGMAVVGGIAGIVPALALAFVGLLVLVLIRAGFRK